MSLYKRKTSPHWYIQYTDPSGKRVQVASGTTDRKAAQELHDKLKHEAWKQSRLDARPVKYWQDAVIQWFADQEGRKRSLDRDRREFRWLDTFLAGRQLDEITRADIADLASKCLAAGASNGTTNRMLALIRAVLRRAAYDWDWIDKAPAVRMLPEPTRRVRFLSRPEADRLIAELPAHLAEIVRFALATGLREQNIVGLQWANVDLDRQCCWVWEDESKGKMAFAVPLNADAVGVIRRQRGKHPAFVFTYRGQPVTRANNHGWANALKRARIEDFRFHDLRHTWASWHVQSGTPIHVLQELGGWKSAEMVRRYAHLSPGHLADYAANVESPALLKVSVSKMQSNFPRMKQKNR